MSEHTISSVIDTTIHFVKSKLSNAKGGVEIDPVGAMPARSDINSDKMIHRPIHPNSMKYLKGKNQPVQFASCFSNKNGT